MRLLTPSFWKSGVFAAAAMLYAGVATAATPYEELPPATRALFNGVAVLANIVPVVSVLYAPQCLPGYVVCKIAFAGASLIAAADQLILSGGADRTQTRAILHRGFGGDWFLNGRHIAGDAQPQPLPEAAPVSDDWQPPPR
jgi:hypothetical protein